jgi:D-alanyl-D-alanine carboxypeptidase
MNHKIIAVVEGEGVVEEFGRLPVPWWSFTKTVLAAAALVLVEAGKLSLDAPVPGYAFTLRHLLQHRAGLRDYGTLPAYQASVDRRDRPWTVDVLLREVGSGKDVFEPGRRWAYSNVGYLFVRRLIEETTGDEIDAALQKLVLARHGFEDVRVAVSPMDLETTAWGNPSQYDPRWVYHGLLVGPPASAALLLHRLLRGSLLRPSLRAEMTLAHRIAGSLQGRPWREAGYGLGLMIGADRHGAHYAGHTGQGPGSTAAVYHCSETGRTAAVFAPVDDQGIVETSAMELAFGKTR